MKIQFRKTSAMLCAITVMASSMSFSGFVANAGDEPVISDYTLTIPATLAVANSGWNATDGISATGTLAEDKKLVVTASSDDEFALVSGENKVNYKLAASGDTNTTYANATAKTSWEFKTLSETATTQPMGIVVEDYSTKPAGDYSDTVTFTAKVENAAYTPQTYTALTSGVVLHVGDTVDSSTTYSFSSLGGSFSSKYTYTLLRADITKGERDAPIVTEKDDGAYYVFKRVKRETGAVSYTTSLNSSGVFSGLIVNATSTSDGVVITQSGSNWNIAVHEP